MNASLYIYSLTLVHPTYKKDQHVTLIIALKINTHAYCGKLLIQLHCKIIEGNCIMRLESSTLLLTASSFLFLVEALDNHYGTFENAAIAAESQPCADIGKYVRVR